jgi:hypothetical protein
MPPGRDTARTPVADRTVTHVSPLSCFFSAAKTFVDDSIDGSEYPLRYHGVNNSQLVNAVKVAAGE